MTPRVQALEAGAGTQTQKDSAQDARVEQLVQRVAVLEGAPAVKQADFVGALQALDTRYAAEITSMQGEGSAVGMRYVSAELVLRACGEA